MSIARRPAISTIAFEPREQGIVRTFEIIGEPMVDRRRQGCCSVSTVSAVSPSVGDPLARCERSAVFPVASAAMRQIASMAG